MTAVHYDAGTPHSFCEDADETSVTSADEDEVTCRPCVARLQRMDMLSPTYRNSLAPLAQRVDWFGGE